jgi:hypothetical protein
MELKLSSESQILHVFAPVQNLDMIIIITIRSGSSSSRRRRQDCKMSGGN